MMAVQREKNHCITRKCFSFFTTTGTHHIAHLTCGLFVDSAGVFSTASEKGNTAWRSPMFSLLLRFRVIGFRDGNFIFVPIFVDTQWSHMATFTELNFLNDWCFSSEKSDNSLRLVMVASMHGLTVIQLSGFSEASNNVL
jgi:hypothetical protein